MSRKAIVIAASGSGGTGLNVLHNGALVLASAAALNLIDGSNVTLTVVNGGGGQVNATITSSGGGGGGVTGSGTTGLLTRWTNGPGSVIGDSSGIVNSDVASAAAIAYSKLALTASIKNSDIAAGAAIAYSKLSLTNSIVNADIASAAAIAYAKLNLSASIVNADIAAGAAIAYSKLALTNSIVNADIASAAAIAYSKLSLTNSIVNADISSAAAIAYSKLSLTASIVNSDIAAGAAIALSKLAGWPSNAPGALTNDGSGTLSWVSPAVAQINTQTGNYTTVLADLGAIIDMSSAGAAAVTIPTHASVAYPVGSTLAVEWRLGAAGQVSVIGAGGVTIEVPKGFSALLAVPGSTVQCYQRATDVWVVTGRLQQVVTDEFLNAIGNITGATNLNMSAANVQTATLTGNVTFTFTNPPGTGVNRAITLYAKQDATGSRTITWPGSVTWGTAGAPTLTTTAGKTDIVTLMTPDGGTTWYGAYQLGF